MKSKISLAQELSEQMELNLLPKEEDVPEVSHAIDQLDLAADLFEETGHSVMAEAITNLIVRIAGKVK